jgi:glycosyltransferase involved in cell wall biosynthesis
LNFGFCRWLLQKKRLGDEVRLMVHEPFYPWRLRDKPKRWLLAAAQRRMMRMLLAASGRVYLSIPAWESLLRPYETGARKEMVWLPIFSTIPVVEDVDAVATLRRQLAGADRVIIGSFGTFGGTIGQVTLEILSALLTNHADRLGLLLGRNGERLAEQLRSADSSLSNRVIAPGSLPAKEISLHLQACDLLVQPYPDGISARRTSAMAGLAHGVPMVTTRGFLSEPLWEETQCVALVATDDPLGLTQSAESLLADSARRLHLGARGRIVYEKHFPLARSLEELQT